LRGATGSGDTPGLPRRPLNLPQAIEVDRFLGAAGVYRLSDRSKEQAVCRRSLRAKSWLRQSGNAKSGALSPGANFLPKLPPKLLSEFLFSSWAVHLTNFYSWSFPFVTWNGEWQNPTFVRLRPFARLSGKMRIVAGSKFPASAWF
jgi:hypothetical protein